MSPSCGCAYSWTTAPASGVTSCASVSNSRVLKAFPGVLMHVGLVITTRTHNLRLKNLSVGFAVLIHTSASYAGGGAYIRLK